MGTALELRQMHYVACLAEEGNVTRAARRLNIVQPALSMQIAKLERRLGQALFERGPRGVRLTPAGERFVALVTPILRDAELAYQAMLATSERIVGRVSIGLVASVARCTMARSCARVAETYPDVQLSVCEGYTDTLVDWVASHQIEMAIVNVARRRLPLAVIPILDEEMVLACRRGRTDVPMDVTLRALEAFPLAVPSKRHGLRRILDDAAANEGVDLRPRLEIDGIAALVEVIATTELVTILPSVAIHKEIASGVVDAYRFVTPRLQRSVAAIHHPQRPLTRAGQATLDVIRSDLVAAAANASRLIGATPGQGPVRVKDVRSRRAKT